MKKTKSQLHLFTEEEIIILQNTWESLGDRKIEVPDRHYNYLFANHPEIKDMFTTEAHLQNARFINSLNQIIPNLDQAESVHHYYKTLGFTHKAYKVRKKHYPLIINSIKHALADVFADEFVDELKDTWYKFVDTIGEIMLEGTKAQYLPKLKKK